MGLNNRFNGFEKKRKSNEILLSAYGCTDIGLVRANNEDSFLLADLSSSSECVEMNNVRLGKRGGLFVVSDGMGGAQAGEVASQMAVMLLRSELRKAFAARGASEIPSHEQLIRAVQHANFAIWNESQSSSSKSGMGATLTAALVRDGQAFIAEVGDSRAYLIRSQSIIRLTTDQSLVELLILAGELTREEAEAVPIKNVILQAMGTQPEVKVAVTKVDLRRNDHLLLCSDGLSNKVSEAEMLKFTLRASSLEMACKQLVELAKRRGGEDNITVIIARVDGEGLEACNPNARIEHSISMLSSFYPTEEDNLKTLKPLTLTDLQDDEEII
ncbi:MAG: Stp1/IreP family PP2C-type Ser/Thr phosphatase [Acidobacteriota bacterium]|nr:Stp1/IreP family PP2C-type Ser/Thr phosphatase [Blastocatellia bacterium]MDW8413407.1 Stp1/IreP family PP2C-type Ser/Thr phosphatase [Acidobacteriota bacterium]